MVGSGRYPDGTRVELDIDAAREQVGEDALCVASYAADRRITGLHVTGRAAPKAPPVWFAEIRESTNRPPAVHLVAFTEHGVAAGTLVDAVDLTDIAVTSEDQLGAVRWYPASGEVDQIYITPSWRRRTVAGALIAAAGTLSVARGWPRLWGDGQRTELGEKLTAASTWTHRAAPLTHTAPPMTPD